MDQIVKDILRIVNKHQIQSDSYDCTELEAELLQLLKEPKKEIEGHVIKVAKTSSGMEMKTVASNGHVKSFIDDVEVAAFIYEEGNVLATEQLKIFFLEE